MRWHHWLILGCILAGGAELRFHLITKNSLWLDEYWAVYLATGRESGAAVSLLHAPRGVLFDPPIATRYAGAPAWWHIWNGLSSGAHPPLYYLVLRGWVDLLGDSDFSTRALSALLSLAGVLALFDLTRRYRGLPAAFLAAGMMSFAVCQTDYSQQVRPYTLIPLLTILSVGAILEIETKGQNAWRLTKLCILTFLLALTHFLALGGIGGLGLYALIRFRGKLRQNVVLILIVALAIFAMSWGPSAWAARQTFASATVYAPNTTYKEVPYFLLIAPYRLLFGSFYYENTPWPIVIFLAILVYVMPWLNRRNPGDLLWWFGIVSSLGLVALLDWHAGSSRPPMLALDRYSIIASPAIYALVSVPAASVLRGKWLGAAALVAAGYILEKPYDWLAKSSPTMIHIYDKPWLPIFVCVSLAMELAVIWRIRRAPVGPAWAWLWASGAILFMITFAAFEKKIPLDLPNLISIASVAMVLGVTMPAVNDMRWLPAGVLLICTAIDAGERFHNGPGEQPDPRDNWRGRAAVVQRAVPNGDPIVFINAGSIGPEFDYMAFSHYAPNSTRPMMLISDDKITKQQILALSGRDHIWIVGGPNGGDLISTTRPSTQ